MMELGNCPHASSIQWAFNAHWWVTELFQLYWMWQKWSQLHIPLAKTKNPCFINFNIFVFKRILLVHWYVIRSVFSQSQRWCPMCLIWIHACYLYMYLSWLEFLFRGSRSQGYVFSFLIFWTPFSWITPKYYSTFELEVVAKHLLLKLLSIVF